jgi:hypothetical protein
MRPTRTPHSRAESGFCAAARIANPVAVKRKKQHHQHHQRHRDHADVACRHQRTEQNAVGERAGEFLQSIAVNPAGGRIEDQQKTDRDHDRGENRRVFDRANDDPFDQHAADKGRRQRDHERRPER